MGWLDMQICKNGGSTEDFSSFTGGIKKPQIVLRRIPQQSTPRLMECLWCGGLLLNEPFAFCTYIPSELQTTVKVLNNIYHCFASLPGPG